jgi:hypothetical protein
LQQIAPYLAAKRKVKCSKTQCEMQQNARCFAAKCKVKCYKTQGGMPQNTRWNVYSCILHVGFLGAVIGKERYAKWKNMLKKAMF